MSSRNVWTVRAALALLPFALAAPATAGAGSFTATITGLTITAVDLDPNDGIAAAFSFGEPWVESTSLAGDVADQVRSDDFDFFGSLRTASTHPATGATASVNQGSGNFAATADIPDGVSGTAYGNTTTLDERFSVTGNTEIRITGAWSVAAEVDLTMNHASYGGVGVSYLVYGDEEIPGAFLLREAQRLSLHMSPNQTASRDGQWALSFTNPSADTFVGRFIVGAEASVGQGPLPPPIPEPSTWAMMFAGLGLLAGAVHRRRRAR